LLRGISKFSSEEEGMKFFKTLPGISFLFIFCFFSLFVFQNLKADVSNIRLNTDTSRELQNEEMIWVSPTDSNIVMAVWRDFRLGYRKVAIGLSIDGGYTWVDSLLKGGVYLQYSDPAIWCDRFGTFYPLTMNFSFNSYGECNLALWKTTDNGATFSGPFYAVHDTVNEYLEDKEFMTIDRTGGTYDGNIYVCWARFPNPTRIMFVRSTDGGINWSDTLIVGSPLEVEGYDAGQFSFPLVDAYGNVYVVWRGRVRVDGVWRACQRMAKSTDGGVSFSPSKAIMINNPVSYAPGGINIYNMCSMDADITNGLYRGNIYLAVPDGVDNGVNFHSDILLIKSTDEGDTWSEPIRVNDEPEDLPIYQFHPWLVVNQEGVIIVFFYDQRNDPPYYEKFDSYITFSFDGGETFTTNYRVSDVSSDPYYAYTNIEKDDLYEPAEVSSTTLKPLAGLLGEYIGVSAYFDRVHCIWTDTREGDQNVYYSNFTIPFLPPRLYLPDDSSYVSAQPGFKWAACDFFDEAHYDLEISTDSNFVTLDFLYSDLDTNLFTLTSPLGETTYYWRVKAFKVSDTTETQYSAIRTLKVDITPPAVPILLSPADSSTVSDSMPEFSWSEVTYLKSFTKGSPVYYTLQVSPDSGFSPELFEYTDISSTSFVMPNVLADYQTYYWKVSAEDLVGNQSGWQGYPFQFWLQQYFYGDTNGDGEVSVSDVVYLISYLFKGGPSPVRDYAADSNCDGEINVSDVIYLINYLFKGGPAPGC
jgi:hypothetical protein